MSETTKPTALAILGDGYTITVTPAAEQQKQTIIEAARRVVAVTDQDTCDLANARIKALASVRNVVEKSRTEVKAPVIELGRKIDGIAKDFVADVIAEESRLSELVTGYAREVQRKAREAQAAAEAQRKQEEAARRAQEAQPEQERAAPEAEAPVAAAVALPAVPALPTGVTETVDFLVEDIAAFYAKFPQLCEVTVKRAEVLKQIKRSLAKNGKLPTVPGLKIFQNIKPKAR
jgi:hypothetical protein